jgi:large subunit ribosomal protein L24
MAFKITWNASKQPKKQRSFKLNAPAHIRGKFLTAPLADELIAKHKVKKLRVRVGDKVKILKGQFKGHVGVVEKVNTKSSKVFVHKAEIVRKAGAKSMYPIHASNVIILEMKADKKRV